VIRKSRLDERHHHRHLLRVAVAALTIEADECAAPDDGNMTVLAKVATPAQQARWLAPIVDGRVRSAFVMTEPHPGSGSDPAMMLTEATRRGDNWVVHGRKWFITGAEAAQHFILIAKTGDDDHGMWRTMVAIMRGGNLCGAA